MACTEPPRRQETRVPDLCNSNLEILHGKFKRLGVAIQQQHEPHPVAPCVPTQLSQVVLNVLVNAFQAIEAAHRSDGRIDIRTQRLGNEFMVEIRDNGIKPEHLPRLFDPFFTTKDVGEGTGVGPVDFASHYFRARRPRRRRVESWRSDLFSRIPAQERKTLTSNDVSKKGRPWAMARKHALLVVDDEKDVGDSVDAIVRREFNVLTARSAEEGLKLMRDNEVHIIMTDQRMPKVTGVELLRSIRAGHPQAIRMLSTDYTDIDSVIAAIDQGHIFAFLKKPWQPDDLENAVREAAAEYERLVENVVAQVFRLPYVV
ncbi:MAG: response regulator [Gemmataceae bacterium]|nr:response regulator [Gemmataceae bacterium]